MMINKQISKEDLVQKFQLYIEASQNEQGVYLLQELILKKEHWLLSITSDYINCTCNNRVEVFLCSLKNFYDHYLLTFVLLVGSIIIKGETF